MKIDNNMIAFLCVIPISIIIVSIDCLFKFPLPAWSYIFIGFGTQQLIYNWLESRK